jgi:ABC-type multidrug transport system ATPase subunit
VIFYAPDTPQWFHSPGPLTHDWMHMTGPVAALLASAGLESDKLYLPGNSRFITPILRQIELEVLTRQFKLETVLRRKAGKLSGGWQRRVSIAMALISEPKILFLDEPTLGLDVIARHDLWEIIRSLKGKVTMILTTHYMEEAESLSDRIGIMKDGRLLALGTAEELKRQAGTEDFEKAFVAIVKEAKV